MSSSRAALHMFNRQTQMGRAEPSGSATGKMLLIMKAGLQMLGIMMQAIFGDAR